MKFTYFKNQHLISILSLKYSWKVAAILFLGIFITSGAVYYTKNTVEEVTKQEFKLICNDFKIKIDARLKANAQLLRSGASYITASDTVTHEEWRKFNETENINRNLPGIQGVGYSLIISKKQLTQHIQFFRRNGFPDYNVTPVGDREIYTSIIYIEPFSGRNLRAFGYDMFSEPIRRKAMEISRDSDYAMLSGKIILVQETNEDLQTGTLMYVPVYRDGMQTGTVEERRAAIKGWIYSPYRMNDLMNGILGNWDLPNKNRVRLKIYDNNKISDEALLYDSQSKDKLTDKRKPNLYLKLPIEFNSKKMMLEFTSNNENLSTLHGEILIVLISGITISLLLFVLSLALINTNMRSRQIQQLNSQLEKLNTDKDLFVSILAHDLRSPFNAILGLSELLNYDIRKLDIDEIEDIAKEINQSARNSYNLLEDILMWARTQSGKIPFKPQKLSFTDIYKDVFEILYPNAEAKNISINYTTDEDLFVFADINMLKTVLRNLVSNAIKFTNEGGSINISAVENSENTTISVSDNGIGIKPDDLKKLFDISLVVSTKGTSEEKGTGFGLLLCKEFVDKHGGKIWAECEAGLGCDFKFTLPKFNGQANPLRYPHQI